MMREIRLLAGLSLRGLYGLNRARYEQDPAARRRDRWMTAVWIFLILVGTAYVAGLSYALIALGNAAAVLPYLSVLATALILGLDMFRVGQVLFSRRGYDVLCAMPVRRASIALSRFLRLYLEDLVLTAWLLLSGALVCVLCGRATLWYLLALPVGILLLPLIALLPATLFGLLLSLVTARLKHKSLWQSLFSVGLVVLILSLSTWGGTADIAMSEWAALVGQLGEMLARLFPPADWLARLANSGEPSSLLYLILSALLPAAATVAVVAWTFSPLMERLGASPRRQESRRERAEQKGLLRTLWLRELRRYFASTIYVTNTIIGPIMGVLMAGALCFGDLDALQDLVPGLPIEWLFPYLLAGVMVMMPPCAVSLSMEGRRRWIIQTLPLPTKTLFDAKLLLNLTLLAPAYLVAEVLTVVALRPSGTALVWLLLQPALLCVFAVVLGLRVNLRFCRWDSEDEVAIVKQSAAAAIGGFAGCFTALACLGAVLLTPPAWRDLTSAALCLTLLLLTVWLYRKNAAYDLRRLEP